MSELPTPEAPGAEGWREEAWSHLCCRPALGAVFAAAASHADLWQGLREFVAASGTQAATRSDVQAIFTFAWWCVAWSDDERMASAARAWFYADLPTRPDLATVVPHHLAAWQFEHLAPAFRARLSDAAYDAFRVGYYGTSEAPHPPELWRELALTHMPSLRETIAEATDHCDLWWSLAVFAAEEGPTELSRVAVASVFGYAWWCWMHSSDEWLASAAEICFYELLPVHSNLENLVPIFIAPWQFERLETVFRGRMTDEEYDAFRDMYDQAGGRAGGDDGRP